MSLKNVIKKILLVSKNEPLTTLNILKRWNIRFGKYIWKKKYTTNELIDLLKKTGLKKVIQYSYRQLGILSIII